MGSRLDNWTVMKKSNIIFSFKAAKYLRHNLAGILKKRGAAEYLIFTALCIMLIIFIAANFLMLLWTNHFWKHNLNALTEGVQGMRSEMVGFKQLVKIKQDKNT